MPTCSHCSKTIHKGEGLLIGTVIGAVLGMLFARRSGKELRKDLSRAGEKEGVLGAATKLGAELKAVGTDAFGVAKEAVDSDTVQDAVSRMRAKGEALVDRFIPSDDADETPPPRPRKVPPKK